MPRRLTRSQEREQWTQLVETGEVSPRAGVNKFNAEKKDVNGRRFHSKVEGDRAIELQWLQQMCKITELKYQVPFELIPKQQGESAVFYYADFTYKDENGNFTVEDVKGHRTAEYRIKRKLLLQVHGIRILETGTTKNRKPLKLRYRKPASKSR